MEKAFGRAGDLVARLGGDEFVAMLPGATLNSTVRAAKRLKEVLANEHEKCRRSGQDCPGFSVSVGCYAVVPHKGTNASELKEAADQYLYEAKREGGRSCVRPAI
jgi:diguanylate cyclase (GGDEF)-like protein